MKRTVGRDDGVGPGDLQIAVVDVSAAAAALVATLIDDEPAVGERLPDVGTDDDPFALLLAAEVIAVHATRLTVVAGWLLEATDADLKQCVALCERVVVKLAKVLEDNGFHAFGAELLALALRLPAEFSKTTWPVSRTRVLELQERVRVLDDVFCGLALRR
jgi:hypothetical protein